MNPAMIPAVGCPTPPPAYFSLQQRIEVTIGRYTHDKDAGQMAVQLAVQLAVHYFFGGDVMVENARLQSSGVLCTVVSGCVLVDTSSPMLEH